MSKYLLTLSKWRLFMKKFIMLFVVSTLVTFLVITTLSYCHAQLPCTTGADVCSYTIDATHRCVNGVGSNSIMPKEDTVKGYRETDNPCGLVQHWTLLGGWQYTGTSCGTAVTPDCT
jgi:hypothetical protein